MKGKCPGCNQTGEVGEPCAETACTKQGYRFIPEPYFDRAHSGEDSSPDPLIGCLVGDFLVVDFLGAGGFGKVYLGLQRPLFRLRGAVKILESPETHKELADALLEKFQREAEVLAELSHPNIVRLLKYGTHQGRPYLVMEYLEKGVTLGREIQRRAQNSLAFTQEELGHIIRQILNGLEAAHARNIIHRDLKPENIMLQEVVGNPYHVRILDFGIAKIIETRADTKWPLGSPTYMAPEQANLKNLGTWTDMYALGVMFFELTTGCRPFPGGSKEIIMSRKLSDEFDPFERVEDLDIPEPTFSFMRRAIAREPEDRFQTAAEFREALEPALEALVEEPNAMGPGGEALTFSMDSRDAAELSAFPGEDSPIALDHDSPAEASAPSGNEAPASDADASPAAAESLDAGSPADASAEPAERKAPASQTNPPAPGASDQGSGRSLRVFAIALVTIGGGLGILFAKYGPEGVGSLVSRGIELAATWGSESPADEPGADTDTATDEDDDDSENIFALNSSADAGEDDARSARDTADDLDAERDTDAADVDAEDVDAQPPLPDGAITQLSAGKYHTCALRADGRVRCWGDNRDGQLGLGHTDAIGDDEQIHTVDLLEFEHPVRQIHSAGDRHASFNCVLLEDGNVRCWGDNTDGQLGYGHTRTIGDEEPIDDLPNVSLGAPALSITAGASKYGSHVCALLEDRSLRCWGNSKFGKLGYGHKNIIGDDELPHMVGTVAVGGEIESVDAGKYNTCAVLTGGELRCWGWNKHGQLGLGHTRDIGDDELPASVSTVDVGAAVEQISVGRRHVCALLESDSVQCWGWNKHGQLGLGHTENIGDDELPSSVDPVELKGPARQVVTGSLHSCALLQNGRVQCWGDNRLGQLGYGHEQSVGDNETPRHSGPVYLGGLARSITAGRYHNCALLEDRSVQCWGFNGRGQLGYGHTNHIGDDEPPGSVSAVPLE